MTVKEYNSCVKLYSDNIYRFVWKHLRNEMSSKDVVQDTFMKVWEKHENVEYEKAKSYLYTTAYNLTINFIKREKRTQSEVGDTELTHGNHSEFSLKETLQIALNKLPEIQKSVILLRDYEGYAYNEIADITSLSEAQVKVYIFRGRQALKKYLVSQELVG